MRISTLHTGNKMQGLMELFQSCRYCTSRITPTEILIDEQSSKRFRKIPSLINFTIFQQLPIMIRIETRLAWGG